MHQVVAAALADLDGPAAALSPASAALLVKLKMLEDRTAELDARAAAVAAAQAAADLAAAAAAGSAKPKSAKPPAKKGKGVPEVAADTPGKRPSDLKPRAEAGVAAVGA